MSDLVSVAYAADFYRRYPGDSLTFFARVCVPAAVGPFRLQITLPAGLAFQDCRAVGSPQSSVPRMVQDPDRLYLIWDLEGSAASPQQYNYQIETRVLQAQSDTFLESQALVYLETEDEAQPLEETVRIAVDAKGAYLKYLPSIYREDDLMGRLLMLYESFWKPIEQQIDHQSNYFDPRLTPPDFLPWLAGWLNQPVDENLPITSRRKLVESSSALLKHRGTYWELKEYLEICTGGEVQIIEHRAKDLCLGMDARFGPGVALGKGNTPNTFTVILRLPSPPHDLSEAECVRREQALKRKVLSIIEEEKPVQAGFDLRLTYAAEPARLS